ncbi:hypothetical protein A2757_01945 [Candidatus Giovannonibacteria bacterium RIFCSPHIGHO2_01_FULL_48_47]|nr:MAG: hypothetical protein A2757_01945 [Candidatus Giovannonibacteria bacterium RIFCSPHIGHO2_01_FULL_48_47]OGF67941.1 MAG: hypothetical protein A3D61_02510 [Candidatus Giovannonibacteria bacterium RIFCSPHIGHO2_02_FULL_48_15]OGF88875.1 MAG: hypothetical protein A3B26_01155 [Candidatus Giovannonibacteria bacterium RIFCSPLOWO2_01_FULL_48_47]OGF96068.1 MAG: hypothetical protein A2613_00660 [Candidatus Giovannonibacteria bacterium RIFOXYD1_FULL_48_21]HBT81215.1 hypothetical protein [Candidatus Gio
MKRDVLLGAVVGFLTGIFTLVILAYLEIDFGYKNLFLPFGIAVLWSAGVRLGYFLARFFPFFRQFGKFATVGFLSASIDFAVLNIVSGLTGVTAGNVVGLVNVPGFAIAVINGYLWNKLWVFEDRGGKTLFNDFPKFLFVTVSGLLLNSLIVVLLTTYIPLPGAFTPAQWLNIAKVFANAVGLIWNFVGYKFVVFVSKK